METPTGALTVIFVSDSPVWLTGLRATLDKEKDIEIVGGSGAGNVLEKVGSLRPDAVLIDARLPEMSGLDTCRQIKQTTPETKVILLLTTGSLEEVMRCVTAGADGYVSEPLDRDLLVRVLQAVKRDMVAISRSLLREIVERLRRAEEQVTQREKVLETLTSREREIFALVARGCSNKEIGRELCISDQTVKTHVSHMLLKLGLPDRHELRLYALRQGLVDEQD
ncbi:MAG: response regulator transcription factor [Chloroflexota bacterium]|nr:response regulator transcription factor [Chloroflexota bacterium]